MRIVSYSNFQQGLHRYMKQVHEAGPLCVLAAGEEAAVVVISKREYDSLQENLRIFSNSYMMNKIRRGERQFKAGAMKAHELIE